MASNTVFDEYKITNGHIRWNDAQTSEELGCTGSLSLETELRTITKMCEGEEVLSEDIPVKMMGTLSLHMPVEVSRRVLGLQTGGLKKGVFAYGRNSRQGAGTLTFDVFDLNQNLKKLMALPNNKFSGGFTWDLVNGQEEIAEIETSVKILRDVAGNFYYEALANEVENNEIIDNWHKNFSYDLVKDEITTGKINTKTSSAKVGDK